MLLNEKLYKNLSLVYVFVIIVTVMNLIIFWVWNCHVFIPFSIATVTMFSVFIKFGGMIPITIYILVSLFIIFMSCIDLIKFKKHIIFPFMSFVLYLFDFLYLILVLATGNLAESFMFSAFSIVLCIIADVIMLFIILLSVFSKRNYLKQFQISESFKWARMESKHYFNGKKMGRT